MLRDILSQQVVHKLGWTLLHSLWQGGVVVLLLAVLLRVLRKSSANLRYVIACLGLAVIVLLPVVTFYIVPAPTPDVESVPGFSAPITEGPYKVYDTDIPLQRAAEYMQMYPTISFKQRVMNYYTSAMPYIVFGWFIGVLALSLWHLGGWLYLQRLKQKKANHVDASLKNKLQNLAERLKVTRPVEIMESVLVQIPTVVGWLRPVILLPASALAGLSPDQIEALIAHELAHIRRYDYLVNMFQMLVEILGFYHPAVWWISYTIRVERENCCDDLAVSVCGDKVGYARALASMEEIRVGQGELVIAANGGSLSRRIRRLIGTGSEKNIRFGYVPVVIAILLVVALMIPTTLALTAKRGDKDSSSVSTEESDSIKTIDADLAAKDQMNDSDRDPVADLDETAIKAQILFDCKIFEVPSGLKIIKGKQKGNLIIDIGGEYAETLEALRREDKNIKLIANPKLLTLDGKQGIIKSDSALPYTAGFETGEDAGDEPKPITRMASAGLELKIKGEAKENGQKLVLDMSYRQFKPSFGTHKDNKGREIQIPVTESSECETRVTVRSNETVVIGGLQSSEGPSRNLILMITPSIVLPEKDPESAKIEMEVLAVDDDPGRRVEFPDAEKEKIKADRHLAELQSLLMQDLNLKMALDDQALELQQKLYEIQTKLGELETRKAELSELNKRSSALASPKEPKSDDEPGYHAVREGDSVAVPGVVLDDEHIEAEKAVIQAQINQLDAQLAELRKYYEAEIFNRLSEWWAEMREFTADVVAAKKSILDAKSVLERDLAALNNIEVEIKNFKLENGANIATDNVLYNKLKTMTANRDALREQIERDKGVLDKYEQEMRDAECRREKYVQHLHQAGTDPNEAETEHERLAVMAAIFAERGDFAKAIEHLEKAIELAKSEKYYGIGVAVEKVDGLIRIVQVLPDAPASGSSFRQGDIIEAFDGVSTEGMSLNEVVARIRGPKETKVTLTVKCHSQDITMKETFTRQLSLTDWSAIEEYQWRLDAYKAAKTGDEYLKIMQKPMAQTAGAAHIYELKYASVEGMARVLNRILEHRWTGMKDKPTQVVKIVPDPVHKKLIVLASPADSRLIEALIAELDVSPPKDGTALIITPRIEPKSDSSAEGTITQIIKLRYADSASVAQILMTLISDTQFRLATDERTNMLIVAGTESTIQQIKDLVAEIDVPAHDKNLEVGEPEKQGGKNF